MGLKKELIPKINFIKGNYMKLSGKSPFSRLIYPVPSKFGLGIHSTLNLSGQTIFGPDDEKVTKINYNVSERKKKSSSILLKNSGLILLTGISHQITAE